MLTLRLESGKEIEKYIDDEGIINTGNMLKTIFAGGAVYYIGNYADGEAYNRITCPEDAECDDYERIVKATWVAKTENKFIEYIVKDMNKIGIDTVIEIHKRGILEYGHNLMWDEYCYKILSQYTKSVEETIRIMHNDLGTEAILQQCFDDDFNFPKMIQMCYEYIIGEQLYDFALEDL